MIAKPFLACVFAFGAAASMTLGAGDAPPPTVDPVGADGQAFHERPLRVLVFSKTAGFRHDSIPAGVDSLVGLGAERGWEVEHTEDAGAFTDESLSRFDVVVFLSTTGDVLDEGQQAAFQRFIAAGKGYAGVHSAADTEYDWAWYGDLVGAYFKTHPAIQEATIAVEDLEHASTSHLSEEWVRRDEWYDYRTNPREQHADGSAVEEAADDPGRIRILASLIAGSYEGSGMGEDHPIAWCREYGGGRAWYTGGGHTVESFGEADFLLHLAGGIEWAGWGDASAGGGERPD